MDAFREAVSNIVSAHGVTCEDKISALRLLLNGIEPRRIVEVIEDIEGATRLLKAMSSEVKNRNQSKEAEYASKE